MECVWSVWGTRGIFFTWSGNNRGLTVGINNIINKKAVLFDVYAADKEVAPTRPHHARQKENCFHLTLFIFSHLKVQTKVQIKVYVFVTLYTSDPVSFGSRLQLYECIKELYMTFLHRT